MKKHLLMLAIASTCFIGAQAGAISVWLIGLDR